MSVYTDVKARGLDTNVQTYIDMTKSDEHPNGIGPWAGDATEEEVDRWQKHLDETGDLPSDGRLTRDEGNLAKWISVSEEMAQYEGKEDDIPKGLRKRAEKVWDDNFKFKEPKTKKRRQTIQMFIALPKALSEEFGGYPEGILWQTLDNPQSVQDLSSQVIDKFPGSKYVEDPLNRMRTDIMKFNKGVFNCQKQGDQVYRPDEPYPVIGMPSKQKKSDEEGAQDEVDPAEIV